jgi:hypothetical protein
MRYLTVYATVILASCPYQTACAQSPLPAAKRGQPAFSFAGGKCLSVQSIRPNGMREYGAGPTVPGTGVVEVSGDGLPARVGTRAPILREGDPAAPSSALNVVRDNTFVSTAKNAGSKNAVNSPKSKIKAATTVVKLLGPDGKFEYKEVPFMGELSSNKRAPNITNVKDGEGKVKEYDWAKNRQ